MPTIRTEAIQKGVAEFKRAMGTPVIFRKFKGQGDIIALFPTHPGTNDPHTCESYMHVGQHSAASVSLVYETDPAHETEYRDLMRELQRIGYDDLRVYARYQPEFTSRRLNALRIDSDNAKINRGNS